MKLSTWAGSKIASALNGESIATTHTLPRQTSTTMVMQVPYRPVTTSVRRALTTHHRDRGIKIFEQVAPLVELRVQQLLQLL